MTDHEIMTMMADYEREIIAHKERTAELERRIAEATKKSDTFFTALFKIFIRWGEASFNAETCPEAHLQSVIREMVDIALTALKKENDKSEVIEFDGKVFCGLGCLPCVAASHKDAGKLNAMAGSSVRVRLYEIE